MVLCPPMSLSNTHFGARLKELREGRGLTQKDLADRAGVSKGAISNWEQGIREPSLVNATRLADALGVELAAFLETPSRRPPAGRGRPRKSDE